MTARLRNVDEDVRERILSHPRLAEEAETLEAMVGLFCRERHGTQDSGLCPACEDFLAYALMRLSRCPYKDGKPVCAKCRTHCYKNERKEEARVVMRFSGPRLVFTHPVLALKHLWYSLTVKPPERARNTGRARPAPKKAPDPDSARRGDANP